MILLSYDGSADAVAALDRVAALMPGAEVTVVTVWDPQRHYDGGHGPGLGVVGVYNPDRELEAAAEQAARECADGGAQRATEVGLVATARCEPREGGTARTLLATAAALDADLIVVGTRGRGGVASFMLGSVSHALVQQADRSVMVVPSARMAEQRHRLGDGAPVGEARQP